MAVPSPDSFVVRLFARDDLEAVLHLGKVREAQQEDFWNTRGINPETESRVAVGSDGQFTGYACIWQAEPPYLDLHIAMTVRAQEQEIRSALYQAAEQRIHSVVEETEPEEQMILRTIIDANHSEEQDFFESQGYLKAKGGYVMEVDLHPHALSAPAWPEGMTVRNFEEGNERSAFALAEQAAWVTEGHFLLWTEPLLAQADCLVVLDVSWPVAAWRILFRHISKSLRGTNPYPTKRLFPFLWGVRDYYLDRDEYASLAEAFVHAYLEKQEKRSPSPDAEQLLLRMDTYGPLSLFYTRAFLLKYLERYQEKVFVVKNPADRKQLFERLSTH